MFTAELVLEQVSGLRSHSATGADEWLTLGAGAFQWASRHSNVAGCASEAVRIASLRDARHHNDECRRAAAPCRLFRVAGRPPNKGAPTQLGRRCALTARALATRSASLSREILWSLDREILWLLLIDNRAREFCMLKFGPKRTQTFKNAKKVPALP